jgi:hypothetical protein
MLHASQSNYITRVRTFAGEEEEEKKRRRRKEEEVTH